MDIFKKVLKIIVLFNAMIVCSAITIFILVIFGLPFNTAPGTVFIAALFATLVLVLGQTLSNKRKQKENLL